MCVCDALVFCYSPAIGNLFECSVLEIMTIGLYCHLGLMFIGDEWLAH